MLESNEKSNEEGNEMGEKPNLPLIGLTGVLNAGFKAIDVFKSEMERAYENDKDERKVEDIEIGDITKELVDRLFDEYVRKQVPIPYRLFLKYSCRHVIESFADGAKKVVRELSVEDLAKVTMTAYLDFIDGKNYRIFKVIDSYIK